MSGTEDIHTDTRTDERTHRRRDTETAVLYKNGKFIYTNSGWTYGDCVCETFMFARLTDTGRVNGTRRVMHISGPSGAQNLVERPGFILCVSFIRGVQFDYNYSIFLAFDATGQTSSYNTFSLSITSLLQLLDGCIENFRHGEGGKLLDLA